MTVLAAESATIAESAPGRNAMPPKVDSVVTDWGAPPKAMDWSATEPSYAGLAVRIVPESATIAANVPEGKVTLPVLGFAAKP